MYDDYETLDTFGPAQIFGTATKTLGYKQTFYSLEGGEVTNYQGVPLMTKRLDSIADDARPDIVLVPGGWGTMKFVENEEFMRHFVKLSESATWVLTVCSGSAFPAKAGLLDGKHATTNKSLYKMLIAYGPKVKWNKSARWVVDGKFYTSSGVSAGMDMALGFIADRHGQEAAEQLAKGIEYVWNSDKDNDAFVAMADETNSPL